MEGLSSAIEVLISELDFKAIGDSDTTELGDGHWFEIAVSSRILELLLFLVYNEGTLYFRAVFSSVDCDSCIGSVIIVVNPNVRIAARVSSREIVQNFWVASCSRPATIETVTHFGSAREWLHVPFSVALLVVKVVEQVTTVFDTEGNFITLVVLLWIDVAAFVAGVFLGSGYRNESGRNNLFIHL